MSKPRVLVIDDEESIRHTLQEYLGLFGYEVITATNPNVCRSLREDQPCSRTAPCTDIVLVDLHMPEVDGLTFLESRVRYGCPNLIRRMALITAVLSREEEARLRELGATFFQKPVPLARIHAWIESVLSA